MIVSTYYIDCSGADKILLNSKILLEKLLEDISEHAKLRIVARTGYVFEPQGISLAYVLSESHIAIHTWPEDGNAYIVLSTCKTLSRLLLDELQEQIRVALQCKTEAKVID